MNLRYYKTLIVSLLSFYCSTLIAKEFTVISLDDFSTIEAIKFQDQSASQTLSLRKYYPNRSFPVPENNLIHFYGIHSDTGASSKRPVLRLSFDEQDDDIIVFLKQDLNDMGKINTQFLKNDVSGFPPLSTMIINLSNHEIVTQLGDKIIRIHAKSRKLIPLPPDERGLFSSKVFFAKRENDKSINYFFISHWRILADSKMLCIIEESDQLDSRNLIEISL